MPKRIEAWKKMQQLMKTKKCKSLGVSNFTIDHIKEIIDKKLPIPQVNQVEFSPYLYQKSLLNFCNKNKIALEAYSPLTRGIKLNDNKLVEIAKKHNKTSAQILLRWCLQHGIVTIPKSVHPNRIKENSDIYNFNISKEDMNKLDGFNENFHAMFNPNFLTSLMSLANRFGL